MSFPRGAYKTVLIFTRAYNRLCVSKYFFFLGEGGNFDRKLTSSFARIGNARKKICVSFKIWIFAIFFFFYFEINFFYFLQILFWNYIIFIYYNTVALLRFIIYFNSCHVFITVDFFKVEFKFLLGEQLSAWCHPSVNNWFDEMSN